MPVHPHRSYTLSYRPFDRLSLFSFCWAIATIFHFLSFPWTMQIGNLPGWLGVIVAILLIQNPRSVWLFMLMLTCSISNVFRLMPGIPNHILFEWTINVGMLLALGWVTIRQVRSPAGVASLNDPTVRESLFTAFAPFVRISLLLLYGFAVFHKLNRDYLNEAISCGAILLEGYARRLPFLPNTGLARLAATWGSLLIETAIPVFLYFKRTRTAGILLGFGFHYFLSIHPHGGLYSFTGLLFALFTLFLPVDFSEKLYQSGQWLFGSRLPVVLTVGRVGIAIVALGLLAVDLLQVVDPYRLMTTGIFIWLGWGLLVIGLFLLVNRRYSFTQENRSTFFAVNPAGLWAVPLFLLFNGLSPYLGLKTGTSFSMFSNLRTEGRQSNHLLVSNPLRLAYWQDDLVEVVATDLDALKPVVTADHLLTYFEFRRIVAKAKDRGDFYVRYVRDQAQHMLTVKQGVSNQPALTTPHPWLVAKFVHFRPIDKQAPCLCKH